MISIEQKILAYSTALNRDSHQLKQLHSLMAADMNVDHLIDKAISEGLGGLLYRALSRSGALEDIDRRHQEILRSIYYKTVLLNTRLIHDLKEVVSRLNRKKIWVVLLQGIALLNRIYDDIGVRPMADIDLWVLKRDYASLINIVNDLGYQRDPLYPNTFRKGSTTFDIHTHILWADRIEARKLLLGKNQDHIYHDTRIIDFEGHEALCLSPNDEFIYLSLHALKHNMDRLIWLVDIMNLAGDWEESDWEGLMDRARELGQEKVITYIFFLLSHIFDFHPPLKIRKLVAKKKLHFLEERIMRRRINEGPFPIWAPLILFSTRKGLRNRFSFILETLFPRPEILRQVFEDSPGCKVRQLYYMRVLQLFGMMKRSLRGRWV